MASYTGKVVGIVTILVALTAYYLRRNAIDDTLSSRLHDILSGLLFVESQVKVAPQTRVAIGFGGCQDLVVQALDLFRQEQVPLTPEHFDIINTWEELKKSFAYFFRYGAAAERYIGNETLLEELVAVASESPDSRWALGGNAPVMGLRFAKEGCEVLLGADMSTLSRETLHPDIKVTGEILPKDDVHLILEYPTDAVWGNYKAPRANRFIVHSDRNNPTIGALESLNEQLVGYNPQLLVISGLQMMDNFPFQPGERLDRLQKIRDAMSAQSSDTRIHFEMASFSDKSLFKELIENIIPYADSLGMNEQELPNIYNMLQHGKISLVSDAHPRIATVLDQMRALFKLLNKKDEVNGKRQLTRLHVHTLAYQAIMIAKGSSWKNNREAAAKASLTAHRHTCGSFKVNKDHAKILVDDSFSISQDEGSVRMPFNGKSPVACWNEQDEKGNNGVHVCIAPVLVCTKVIQTAGGGDNISAAGLVLQI